MFAYLVCKAKVTNPWTFVGATLLCVQKNWLKILFDVV